MADGNEMGVIGATVGHYRILERVGAGGMESTAPDHSGAEGVGVDAQGNVYGGVVRRQMLERHTRKTP